MVLVRPAVENPTQITELNSYTGGKIRKVMQRGVLCTHTPGKCHKYAAIYHICDATIKHNDYIAFYFHHK